MIDIPTVIRGFKAELSAKFIYYITTGVVIVFLTRQLPPGEYGRLFLVVSILSICRLFSSVGLAKSAATYVSNYLDTDATQVRHIVRKSLQYNLVMISIVSIALFFLAGSIAGFLDDSTLEPLLVAGVLYVVFATLYNYSRVVLQGFQNITQSATVYASEGVGRLLFVVGLVTIGFGTMGALVGYILGFVVAAVIGLVFLYRQTTSHDPAETMELGLQRDILSYSVPLTVTRGAWVLDREVDIVIVGIFLRPATVGFYTIGKQVVTFCIGPASSIGFAIGPQYSEASVAGDEQGAARAYETMLVSGLLLYVPAIAGLIILTDPIVTTVFGADYRGAVPILQVFAVGIALLAVTEMTEDILDYLGKATARAKMKIVTSTGNVVLTIVLIQILGAVGAALATVLMQFLYTGLCLYLVESEIRLRRWHLLKKFGQICVITAVMAVAVGILSQYVTGAITLGAIIVSGAVIWAALAIGSGLIDFRTLLETFQTNKGE